MDLIYAIRKIRKKCFVFGRVQYFGFCNVLNVIKCTLVDSVLINWPRGYRSVILKYGFGSGFIIQKSLRKKSSVLDFLEVNIY
jgi:hypothetical protein